MLNQSVTCGLQLGHQLRGGVDKETLAMIHA